MFSRPRKVGARAAPKKALLANMAILPSIRALSNFNRLIPGLGHVCHQCTPMGPFQMQSMREGVPAGSPCQDQAVKMQCPAVTSPTPLITAMSLATKIPKANGDSGLSWPMLSLNRGRDPLTPPEYPSGKGAALHLHLFFVRLFEHLLPYLRVF
ncbi:hypothetical protein B0J14DRAFT_18088 [Halenospora varia]|nr:hypothetical protein B0J14DRAFT_18088 [Halenospora varia]